MQSFLPSFCYETSFAGGADEPDDVTGWWNYPVIEPTLQPSTRKVWRPTAGDEGWSAPFPASSGRRLAPLVLPGADIIPDLFNAYVPLNECSLWSRFPALQRPRLPASALRQTSQGLLRALLCTLTAEEPMLTALLLGASWPVSSIITVAGHV